MAEKETQVESKETPHLVNMEIDTILSMVDRVSADFFKAGADVAQALASGLSDKEFFNLFFALEFLFRSPQGQQYRSRLSNDGNTVFLFGVLMREMRRRTGLEYDYRELNIL